MNEKLYLDALEFKQVSTFTFLCPFLCVSVPEHRPLPLLSYGGSGRHLQMKDGRLLMLHCWSGKGLLPLAFNHLQVSQS